VNEYIVVIFSFFVEGARPINLYVLAVFKFEGCWLMFGALQ